jgi:putative intracellular protease/amidase
MTAADLVEGRKIAGWLACKEPVNIMGGIHNWDWSAVIDGQIVTGRVPNDIPEFIDAIFVLGPPGLFFQWSTRHPK